jgi:hypothetical protein
MAMSKVSSKHGHEHDQALDGIQTAIPSLGENELAPMRSSSEAYNRPASQDIPSVSSSSGSDGSSSSDSSTSSSGIASYWPFFKRSTI